MKNYSKLLPIALLCMAGCSSEDIDNDIRTNGHVLNATIEQRTNTRVDVTSGNSLVWTSGDQFTAFGDASYIYTLSSGAGEAEGSFTTASTPMNLTYAVYPTSDNPALSGSTLTMTLPASYEYSSAKGIGIPMFCAVNDIADISFRHLAGMLRVELTGAKEGTNTLTLTSSAPVSGTFTADLSSTSPTLASESTSESDKTVTVTFTAESGINTLYIPLPVQAYGDIQLTLNDKELISWTDKTVERATIYTASLNNVEVNGGTPSSVGNALTTLLSSAEGEETYTVNISGTITSSTSDQTIVVPQVESANVVLNFGEAPTETTEATPLKIEGNTSASVSDSQNALTVSVPTDATDVYVDINTPTTTVSVEGSYKVITARTATNTLVIKAGTVIDRLIANGGNIILEEGAIVAVAERGDDNTDKVTYIGLTDGHELGNATELWESEKFELSNAIPAHELQALKDLFASTNGESWTNKTNWNTSNPVYSWFGLTVENGSVRQLSLSNQLSGELPASIGDLTNLESLNLGNNDITGTLPESIGNLSKLTSLNLQYTKLTGDLPESIGNLTALKDLNIGHSSITGIPESIGNLTNLFSIYALMAPLKSLPENIGKLTNLNALAINSDQLTSIPESIGDLTNIQGLRLFADNLAEFPTAIGKLTNLNSLMIGSSQWTSVPNWIGNLVNLNTLYLSGSLLTEIPENIGNLTKLRTFILQGWNESSGNITTIPECIFKLTNLQALDLSDNQITNIPDGIGNLPNLRRLHLKRNKIASISANISNLTKLTSLNLDSNKLENIPQAIYSFSDLKELFIGNNQLTGSIPNQIGELTELTNLSLRNNQLSGNIPSTFTNLKAVKWLYLDGNCLSGQVTQEVSNWLHGLTMGTLSQKDGYGLTDIDGSTLGYLWAH